MSKTILFSYKISKLQYSVLLDSQNFAILSLCVIEKKVLNLLFKKQRKMDNSTDRSEHMLAYVEVPVLVLVIVVGKLLSKKSLIMHWFITVARKLQVIFAELNANCRRTISIDTNRFILYTLPLTTVK